jgi:hypothetical protein
VPLKIAYLLMRWLLGLVALVSRGDRAKDAELLVLRDPVPPGSGRSRVATLVGDGFHECGALFGVRLLDAGELES